jgi:tRNA dimethylallyltransferase
MAGRPKPVVIVGPTATGKSDLAVALAERLDGEVVNADSRQVYRCLNIGTAKPSPEVRQRIPHHLFDLVRPDEEFSVALYTRLARQAVEEVARRGKLPIIVGGTGHYVWALLEGYEVPPVPPDPDLRRQLRARAEREGPEALYAELRALDPEAAARIDPRNLRRVIRALEVIAQTGRKFSELRRKNPPPWDPLVIGLTLDRKRLYERIDRRVEAMLAAGWLDEVRRLLEKGYSADLPALTGHGYRWLIKHLKGEISLEEAIRLTRNEIHDYARHQYAWFRLSDPRITWLQADDPDLVEKAAGLVGRHLAGGG